MDYDAILYGIEPGIDPTGLEQRTATWLRRKPGHQRRTRVTHTFHRIPGYEQTDNLLVIPGMRAHEDEIDGHLVMVFMLGGNCVGMWYNGGRTGSFCLDFQGDDLCYAERDPFWPWQD